MPCTSPLDAYLPVKNGAGERSKLIFKRDTATHVTRLISIPCGKCYGCRKDHASEWGTRCALELQGHPEAMFITLTYAPEHLPANYGVSVRELQLFMKRLRQHIALEHDGKTIRFIASGEYGGQTGRPHYHILTFGWRFPDGIEATNSGANPLYMSPTLDRLWGKGRANYGSGTEGVGHYIAGYTVKKLLVSGDTHAEFIDGATGEIHETTRPPEFITMSRKPGIGMLWLEQYKTDLEKGFLTIEGRKKLVPKAFIKRLKKTDPDFHEALRKKRVEYMLSKPDQKHRLHAKHLLGLDELAQNQRDTKHA